MSERDSERETCKPEIFSKSEKAVEGHDQQAERSFAAYLAKRLVGEKRYRPDLPEEASELAAFSDIVLTRADLGLSIVCIIDRVLSPQKSFPLDRELLLSIGKACLNYTGTMNGSKMPVSITLYELSDHPPNQDTRHRIRALQKTFPGFLRVQLAYFYVDESSRKYWTDSPLAGLTQGGPWLHELLHKPRKRDEEIFALEPKLTATRHIPYLTLGIVLFLLCTFILEQATKEPENAVGLLSIDAPSLFALGAMNVKAVLHYGEWYRLLSAAILHIDALHFGLNGLALGLAGHVFESRLCGRSWLAIVLFAGVLGGSLMGLAVNPSDVLSVGASGAIMGLGSAGFVLSLRLPTGPQRRHTQSRLMQLLVPSLIPLITHRQGGRIDFAAHLGGAVAGAVVGLVLMKRWPPEQTPSQKRGILPTVTFCLVLCFAASLLMVRTRFEIYGVKPYFSSSNLLISDSKIPKDLALAKRDVDIWGQGYARDPRVRAHRALRFADDGKQTEAIAELRAGLAERGIFAQVTNGKELEIGMRIVLCQLLVKQGEGGQARDEARVLCVSPAGPPRELVLLSLCD